MRILVVDDDEITRCLIEESLRYAGHQVLVAANGVSGMRLLRREQPDIVITDILMPDQDGFGMIMAVRREKPAAKIIAISGGGVLGSLDLLVSARRLGADDTLVKPVMPDALLDCVNRFLPKDAPAAAMSW
jgi:two-component system, chemotaxis family, chemotaxis protein CheY